MKLDRTYEHFKLWQIFPSGMHAENQLHKYLKIIFSHIANYFEFLPPASYEVPHKMSFYNALQIISERFGLKLLPLAHRYERLSVRAPIVARDRNKDQPVLLLPYNLEYYLRIDDETRKGHLVSVAQIPIIFDEHVQLVPVNTRQDTMNHVQVAKLVGTFLPFWPLFFLSLASFSFSIIFLLTSLPNLDDMERHNRIPLLLSMVVTITFLVMIIGYSRWLSIKNYGLGLIYVLYDFYRRMVFLVEEKSLQITPSVFARQSFDIECACTRYFSNRFTLIFSMASISIFLLLALMVDLSLASLYLVFLGIVLIAIFTIRKKRQQIYFLYRDCEDTTAYFLDCYSLSLNALIGLHVSQPLMNMLMKQQRRLMQIAINSFSLSYIIRVMYMMLPIFSVICVALWLSYQEQTTLPPWRIVFLILLSIGIGIILSYLCEHGFELLSSPSDPEATKEMATWSLEIAHTHVQPVNVYGNIELINVSFTYEDNGRLIIKNSDLRCEAEKFCVIYGQSGSGKSTLLKLLMGLITPHSGYAVIDGQDIRSLDRNSLRNYFGVVLEESTMFSGSVYENILCGRSLPKKSLRALLLSHEIFDVLIDMPMGLETYIFWHAKNISHWERSIILLARALLHKPKVLFIDGLLSGLDSLQQTYLLRYFSILKMTRILTSTTKLPEAQLDRIYAISDHTITQN
jgi:ABC-type multidrug transport system fused ATPase/permease subunit